MLIERTSPLGILTEMLLGLTLCTAPSKLMLPGATGPVPWFPLFPGVTLASGVLLLSTTELLPVEMVYVPLLCVTWKLHVLPCAACIWAISASVNPLIVNCCPFTLTVTLWFAWLTDTILP